jgi:hypothetical protein
MLNIKKLVNESDFNDNLTREQYVDFLHTHLDQFGDSKEAINKCIDFAFGKDGKLGGFLLAAYYEEKLVGALIINNTGMSGYIPEHILVYVAVDGIVEYALKECPGDVKLHVEYENPAKRLYERIGFTTKYAEMRYKK